MLPRAVAQAVAVLPDTHRAPLAVAFYDTLLARDGLARLIPTQVLRTCPFPVIQCWVQFVFHPVDASGPSPTIALQRYEGKCTRAPSYLPRPTATPAGLPRCSVHAHPLRREMELARRKRSPFSLLMADVTTSPTRKRSPGRPSTLWPGSKLSGQPCVHAPCLTRIKPVVGRAPHNSRPG